MEQVTVVAKDKETRASTATEKEKMNKQKKKAVPVSKDELEKLAKDSIVQCDPSTAPQRFKAATTLFRCELCKRHFETVSGAKGHTQEKKHVEKKNLKKVEEELKLVGSPNEEQFDAITVKLQQVYNEWSAEACGQLPVREKIVSDFQEFVQRIKGCEGVIVEPFGSTYTRCALKSSDINMNLVFKDRTITDPLFDIDVSAYLNNMQSEDVLFALYTACLDPALLLSIQSLYYAVINAVVEHLTAMANSSGDDMVYTDLNDHLYSSVSHITFTHRPSGISCHVRFGCHHAVPICTGKLLRQYGEVDNRVKMLAVVLKYWAKLCQLDIQELGSYPSQMFVLMLIHFLQQRSPPVLPVPPKPNDFSDLQQCLEHFDEYLSGLDDMIKTWRTTNTESLGMLWFGMFRFYCEEADLGEVIIHITEKDLLSKKDNNWSTNKLVVLSPVHPSYNMAKACSSQNMYLYLKICFKATMVYFGRNSLNKPSAVQPPAEDHNASQDLTSQTVSHDPSTTENSMHPAVNSPKHTNSDINNVSSQLDDFNDNGVKQSNEPVRSEDDLNDSDMLNHTIGSYDTTSRSHNPDCDVSYDLDTSCDLDHDESLDPNHGASRDLDHDSLSTSEVETSCEHNNTQLDDSVMVEDNDISNDDNDNGVEGAKGFQYQFTSTNFIVKRLPDVCSLCKQEGHTFTSPDCPDKEEEIKLAKHPLPSIEQLEQLDKVFIDLKENICLKPIDKKQRIDVCHILEQFIKAIFPEAELMLFGSSANEFGSPNSDIDISMKLPGTFEVTKSVVSIWQRRQGITVLAIHFIRDVVLMILHYVSKHDRKAEVIQKVAHELKFKRQHHWWVNSVQPITTARVPIVKMKLMQKWNNLDCDISLGNYLALHNTQLLAAYASIDNRVQVLGYVLKEFAKSSEMCDASSGSLSSYAYIILLLHYLQQVTPPVIPVLQQIGKKGSCVDVDGWNCWFYQFGSLPQLNKIWPHVGENKSTIGELLINFFKYYLEEFEWHRHVVCIRQLELLSKLEKQWASKRACIEDPFNLDHNLSSHLSNRMWSYIRNAFKCAHDHIADPQLYTHPLTISTVLSVGFTKNVPQDGLCHTCGKRGHISRYCPNNMIKKSYTCFRCGKKGHVRAECTVEMSTTEQGESTDNGSNLPTPAVVEAKRKRKTKTMTKVVEGKPDEPIATSASPKTKSTPPAGLLPHPHNREYPPSPVKQSNPLLPDPPTASPPCNTVPQFLPPYPQSHPSVPYTASRQQPPVSPRYNQQPQMRHPVPISTPTISTPTRPFIFTSPHERTPYAEFNNSPPRHQCYSHMMNFMQPQSPPVAAAYGSNAYGNSGGMPGNYYLFPPPSSPVSNVPQGGYNDIQTALRQIRTSAHHQQQQPQGHNPQMVVPVPDSDTLSGVRTETDHRHKKPKYRKPTRKATETMVGSNAVDLTELSLSDDKQGRPAVRLDSNRRQPASKGRGRIQRGEASTVGHHGGKQHHQKNT